MPTTTSHLYVTIVNGKPIVKQHTSPPKEGVPISDITRAVNQFKKHIPTKDLELIANQIGKDLAQYNIKSKFTKNRNSCQLDVNTGKDQTKQITFDIDGEILIVRVDWDEKIKVCLSEPDALDTIIPTILYALYDSTLSRALATIDNYYGDDDEEKLPSAFWIDIYPIIQKYRPNKTLVTFRDAIAKYEAEKAVAKPSPIPVVPAVPPERTL